MTKPRPPRPSKRELPNAIDVMRNTLRFQGEQLQLPRNETVRGGFRVAGLGLGEVHDILQWETGGIGTTVGHYDPAQQEWQIFPECVPDTRQARALGIEVQYKLPPARREALAEGRRPGGGFVDFHAPGTHEARAALEQQLAPLQPMEFAYSAPVSEALGHGDMLHQTKGTSFVGTDALTFCFPTLSIYTLKHEYVERVGVNDTITTSEREFRPDAILALCYSGLIVQAPNQRGNMRTIRSVPVALRDLDLGWIPNADLVTPEQWDILRPIAGTLIEMSLDIPRFSPLYSSVVYGEPGPETLHGVSME